MRGMEWKGRGKRKWREREMGGKGNGREGEEKWREMGGEMEGKGRGKRRERGGKGKWREKGGETKIEYKTKHYYIGIIIIIIIILKQHYFNNTLYVTPSLTSASEIFSLNLQSSLIFKRNAQTNKDVRL